PRAAGMERRIRMRLRRCGENCGDACRPPLVVGRAMLAAGFQPAGPAQSGPRPGLAAPQILCQQILSDCHPYLAPSKLANWRYAPGTLRATRNQEYFVNMWTPFPYQVHNSPGSGSSPGSVDGITVPYLVSHSVAKYSLCSCTQPSKSFTLRVSDPVGWGI